MKHKFVIIILVLSSIQNSHAFIKRRPVSKANSQWGYFVAPIAGRIAGIGNAYGGVAMLQNVFNTPVDVSAVAVGGDAQALSFNISSISFFQGLINLDASAFDARIPINVYDRGMASGKNNFYKTDVQEVGGSGQLRINLWERRMIVFGRGGSTQTKVKRILDNSNNEFQNIDNEFKPTLYSKVGGTIDLTDDPWDPRFGLKLEGARTELRMTDPAQSKSYELHYRGTIYIPLGKSNTLAFNYYRSKSEITEHSDMDGGSLKSNIGLKCELISDSAIQQSCYSVEAKRVEERLVSNRFGNAGYLGGPESLRAYPVNRFRASETQFWGSEFRWNLTDENKPFNFLFVKGVRSHIQLALFYELGAVSDPPIPVETLPLRSMGGVGLRMVFSGMVLRAEYGVSEEGGEFQVFFGYPWSLPIL